MRPPAQPMGVSLQANLPTSPPTTDLQLLQRFELRVRGEPASLPDTGQRLVAFLAVRNCPQRRTTVAGTLWGDTTDDHAAANLRTALWRTRRVDPDLVRSSGGYLSI